MLLICHKTKVLNRMKLFFHVGDLIIKSFINIIMNMNVFTQKICIWILYYIYKMDSKLREIYVNLQTVMTSLISEIVK